MDGYNIYPDPALRGKPPWPLIASSLWLRLGFVAATGAVMMLIELYKGEASPLAALAWIFGGAWLAASRFAFRLADSFAFLLLTI